MQSAAAFTACSFLCTLQSFLHTPEEAPVIIHVFFPPAAIVISRPALDERSTAEACPTWVRAAAAGAKLPGARDTAVAELARLTRVKDARAVGVGPTTKPATLCTRHATHAAALRALAVPRTMALSLMSDSVLATCRERGERQGEQWQQQQRREGTAEIHKRIRFNEH